MKKNRPFGLWPSPVSAISAANKMRFEDVQFDRSGDSLLWVEGRSGSGILVHKKKNNARKDITSTNYSIRGGIGYGGGEFSCPEKAVIFSEKSGRIFRMDIDSGQPIPLTPPYGAFADPQGSPDGQWIVSVFSDGTTDLLSLIPMDGNGWPIQLVRGADFYTTPRWHPNGKTFAWVEWDHPNMPWDGTRLKLGRLEGNPPRLVDSHIVAGDESIPAMQPQFSPDGRYLSYLVSNGEWEDLILLEVKTGESRILLHGEGFHLAQPAWIQGMRSYAWSFDSQYIFIIQNRGGFSSLSIVEIESGEKKKIDTDPYTWITQISASPISNDVAFLGTAPGIPSRVVRIQNGTIETVAYSDLERLTSDYFSLPASLEWSAPDGSPVFGTFYPPANPEYQSDGLPPAIVYIHGGPTSEAPAVYSAERTYFTTRGYGWFEVNYRGSSGQGRTYLQALRSNWGLTDREDAAGAANTLIKNNLADPKRLIIRGGSAGGYTVLNTLIHFPGLFKAGVCCYGVSNLFSLAQDTHKFESHYNDSLVGSLPDAAEKYHAWSPIFHADKITDALAVFQGDQDKVVPPSQSEAIVKVLQHKGIPLLYEVYSGEGHGFRKDETLTKFYTEMERFLQQFVLFAL